MNEDEIAKFKKHMGTAIGKTIWSLFEMAAAAEGVEVEEVVEGWISSYIAGRIMEPGKEGE